MADDRLFRLYVVVFQVDFMAEHGQVFNGNQRPSSVAARAQLSAVFAVARSGSAADQALMPAGADAQK